MLGSAAAIALGAGGLGAAKLLRRRRTRYFVATEEAYYKVPQDFSAFMIGPNAEGRGLPKVSEAKHFTILTAVNDDGSDVRRLKIGGRYHCVTSHPGTGLIYLLGNYEPNYMVALDPYSLEAAGVWSCPEPGAGRRNFGGHAVPIPGTSLLAVSMNNCLEGHYDQISIRDALSMKEVERFSSYGFDLHEVRLSPDQSYFVCGHYGSYLGRSGYRGLADYKSVVDDPRHPYSYHIEYVRPPKIYPAAVAFVDAKSGQRRGIFASRQNGQSGHALSDDRGNAYLPHPVPRIESDPEFTGSAHFREGPAQAFAPGVLGAFNHGVGITLDFDDVNRETIVPLRSGPVFYVQRADSSEVRQISYADQLQGAGLDWMIYDKDCIGGMMFHPDGKHFILSTRCGILAFERGTYRLNPRMSFPLPLQAHSHMHVV